MVSTRHSRDPRRPEGRRPAVTCAGRGGSSRG